MKSGYYRGKNENLFLLLHFFFIIKFQNGYIEVILNITEMAKNQIIMRRKNLQSVLQGRETLRKRMKPRYTVMWLLFLYVVHLSSSHSVITQWFFCSGFLDARDPCNFLRTPGRSLQVFALVFKTNNKNNRDIFFL